MENRTLEYSALTIIDNLLMDMHDVNVMCLPQLASSSKLLPCQRLAIKEVDGRIDYFAKLLRNKGCEITVVYGELGISCHYYSEVILTDIRFTSIKRTVILLKAL